MHDASSEAWAGMGNRGLMERLTMRLAARKPLQLSAADHSAFASRAFVAPVVIERDVVGRLWVLGGGSRR